MFPSFFPLSSFRSSDLFMASEQLGAIAADSTPKTSRRASNEENPEKTGNIKEEGCAIRMLPESSSRTAATADHEDVHVIVDVVVIVSFLTEGATYCRP
jgi:hypothetical protein